MSLAHRQKDSPSGVLFVNISTSILATPGTGYIQTPYTVKPVYNSNHAKWLLNRGGLLIEVGCALWLCMDFGT